MMKDTSDIFIDYLRKQKRYSKHTLVSYESDIAQFQEHLAEKFSIDEASAIERKHIRSWLVALSKADVSAASIRRKMSSLSTFCHFLRLRGVLDNNPIHGLSMPSLPKRIPKALDANVLNEVLETAPVTYFPQGYEGSRDLLVLDLLYSTGIRKSELISLKVENLRIEEAQISVLGKGNKTRLVPLLPQTIANFKSYLDIRATWLVENKKASSDIVFLTKKGRPLYPKFVDSIVQKYIQPLLTSCKVTPHQLRHSFATHLMNNGAELLAVKELLGHASLASTQVYLHYNIEQLKKVYKQAHPRAEND